MPHDAVVIIRHQHFGSAVDGGSLGTSRAMERGLTQRTVQSLLGIRHAEIGDTHRERMTVEKEEIRWFQIAVRDAHCM